MKMEELLKNGLLAGILFLCFAFAKAQLGFCPGVAGDVIFNEDFGSGTTNGPPLPSTVTNYDYVNSETFDGQYTISNNMQQLGSFWNLPDHTGNTNGKMLIVNAGFDPGIFYQIPINGLCENTPYELSAWIINVYNPNSNACPNRGLPIEVQFQIWDSTDTNILAFGTMPAQRGQFSPAWIQYGLTFTTAPGQNGCILKLINQGEGGCGNDLAIDDIQFRPCGDVTNVSSNGESNTSVCVDDLPTSVTLQATTTTSVFASPEYQWQRSDNGATFIDIPGATSATYTSELLNTSTSFRLKLAEDAINLSNSQCVNFSETFRFEVDRVNNPVPSQNTVISCDGETVELSVQSQTGVVFDWYDSATGGNLLLEGSSTFESSTAGTYYVEARTVDAGCLSDIRTAIEIAAASGPVIPREELFICASETATLTVDISPATYSWNNGATTQSIDVNSAGIYECEVTTPEGCVGSAVFEVMVIEVPVIEELDLIGEELEVVVQNPNPEFVYSLDGINYQTERFFNVSDLLEVNVFAKNATGCDVVTASIFRVDINLFFTPNDDGFNDRWTVDGLNNFPGSRIEIFNRFGTLLRVLDQPEVTGWDGTFNGAPLPSSDYWFKLYYDDQVVAGHFTLKR